MRSLGPQADLKLAALGAGILLRERLQPLAQQDACPKGSQLQISLGPQRSHRPSETSSTIHTTSSSQVVPAMPRTVWRLEISVMPEWIQASRGSPVPSIRGVTVPRKTRASAAKRTTRRQR